MFPLIENFVTTHATNLVKNLVYATYVPFVGWLPVMVMKKDEPLAMHHARQGFVFAVIFTAVAMILSFSTVFIPRNFRTLKLVIICLIYFSHLFYFGLCVAGTLMIRKGKTGEFFFIDRLVKKIDL